MEVDMSVQAGTTSVGEELNLQSRYDLEVEKDKLEGRIEKEVKILERKTA